MLTHTSPTIAKDSGEDLLDALAKSQTDLERAIRERDRLEAERDKLARSNRDLAEKHRQDKEDYRALNANWVGRYMELESKYKEILDAYDSLNSSVASSPMTTSSDPDRLREPRKPAREGHREDRGRARDEAGRDRHEKRLTEADKERLSRRFEDRRPPVSTSRRPAVDGRASGSRRSSSANPLSRKSPTQAPLSPPYSAGGRGNNGYAVPRTPNPLSPAFSSGSSTAYGEDRHEDGNYHAYPVQH